MRLENKTAIITGATGGIGEATTRRFLDEGANVALVGRSEEKLSNLISNLGNPDNAIYCIADSKDEVAIKNSINTTHDKFGSVDIVMANAGTEGIVKPLTEFTVEEFNDVIDVNVVGVWLFMKHSMPIMQKQKAGSFIAVASTAGPGLIVCLSIGLSFGKALARKIVGEGGCVFWLILQKLYQ